MNKLWIYKPKEEHRKDVLDICKNIRDETANVVTEKLSQIGKENTMDDVLDAMSSCEKYNIATTLIINLDSSLVLTEEQYKFLRQHTPGKDIVIEDLDFKKTKAETEEAKSDRGKAYNKMIHLFDYSRYKSTFENCCYLRNVGLIKVNPAYTSKIASQNIVTKENWLFIKEQVL